MARLVAGQGSGSRAQHLLPVQDLLAAGMEPVAPELVAAFLSGKPPGKPGSSSCSPRFISCFIYLGPRLLPFEFDVRDWTPTP